MKNILTLNMKSILILVFSSILLASCAPDTPQEHENRAINYTLPPNAKVIKNLGKGWLIVEIENNKFVYRYFSAGNCSTEVLAPWKDENAVGTN